MKYRKEIATTAGTLACAIGIGFFMQQGGAVPVPKYEGAILINTDAAVLDVEGIVLTSAEVSDSITPRKAEMAVTLAAATQSVEPNVADASDMLDAGSAQVQPDATCEVTANARPIAAAMVNLKLSAPCLPNERVTVHHSGLLFNQMTDAAGALDITIPAMATDATFIVAFTNGEGAVAQARVEEIADFDRVALQWKGDTGFELHAREFGAEYGSEGHVWSGVTRDMTYAVTGRGGYIHRLGDFGVPDGLLAEVYTFPASATQTAGDIALSVEAEVGKNNCGLEIEARTLQTFSGKDITSRDLTLSVPDCDATGNFLVLNNLFEDLKVAAIN